MRVGNPTPFPPSFLAVCCSLKKDPSAKTPRSPFGPMHERPFFGWPPREEKGVSEGKEMEPDIFWEADLKLTGMRAEKCPLTDPAIMDGSWYIWLRKDLLGLSFEFHANEQDEKSLLLQFFQVLLIQKSVF